MIRKEVFAKRRYRVVIMKALMEYAAIHIYGSTFWSPVFKF